MKIVVLMLILALMAPAAGLAAEGQRGTPRAQPAPQVKGVQTGDEAAVRASADAFVAAFNNRDAKAVAALWTSDGEYADETGRVIRGRDAIEKEFAEFFTKNPGLTMESSISSVKIVRGSAAVEEGTSVVRNEAGKPVSRGRYTALLLKDGDAWLLASVREHAAPALSLRPGLGDLEWLIGHWSATNDSRSVDFTFRWISEKKFIELSYSAQEKGATATSGIRVIGLDPSSGEVVSWSFDSSGGLGRGHWKLLKKGYVVDSRGVLADGTPVSSTEILSKVDEKHFAWRSTNRMVAGQKLNDTKSLILTRKSP